MIWKQNAKLVALSLILTLTTVSMAHAQGLPTSDDYPKKAMREGRQGTVKFKVVIDEHGKPESCEVLETSGSQDLDEAACAIIMERGSFTPSMRDGKPVKRSWISTFRWVIPTD